MKKREVRRYSVEFKEQIVKEVLDLGTISIVARKHNIPIATIHSWLKQNSVNSGAFLTKKAPELTTLQMQKKLTDAELEIRVLKELLKKTNQAWLKE